MLNKMNLKYAAKVFGCICVFILLFFEAPQSVNASLSREEREDKGYQKVSEGYSLLCDPEFYVSNEKEGLANECEDNPSVCDAKTDMDSNSATVGRDLQYDFKKYKREICDEISHIVVLKKSKNDVIDIMQLFEWFPDHTKKAISYIEAKEQNWSYDLKSGNLKIDEGLSQQDYKRIQDVGLKSVISDLESIITKLEGESFPCFFDCLSSSNKKVDPNEKVHKMADNIRVLIDILERNLVDRKTLNTKKYRWNATSLQTIREMFEQAEVRKEKENNQESFDIEKMGISNIKSNVENIMGSKDKNNLSIIDTSLYEVHVSEDAESKIGRWGSAYRKRIQSYFSKWAASGLPVNLSGKKCKEIVVNVGDGKEANLDIHCVGKCIEVKGASIIDINPVSGGTSSGGKCAASVGAPKIDSYRVVYYSEEVQKKCLENLRKLHGLLGNRLVVIWESWVSDFKCGGSRGEGFYPKGDLIEEKDKDIIDHDMIMGTLEEKRWTEGKTMGLRVLSYIKKSSPEVVVIVYVGKPFGDVHDLKRLGDLGLSIKKYRPIDVECNDVRL